MALLTGIGCCVGGAYTTTASEGRRRLRKRLKKGRKMQSKVVSGAAESQQPEALDRENRPRIPSAGVPRP